MLEFRKRMHKVVTHTLVALVLLQVFIGHAEAATQCHKCTGINCQRTTYAATEDCADALDSCVSVFQGSTVLAQGCLGQLAVELRNKCEMPSAEETDEAEVMDADGAMPAVNRECHQCSEDLCNNVSAEGVDCIQCDSNADAKCASDTDNLQPQRCPISRAMNTYCYAKIEGNRATRGCATDLTLQKECSSNSGCSLCSPSDIVGCNRGPKLATDESSSGGSSSGGGGSGSDSGAGSSTGNGGSSSGGGGSGSDSGAGAGSGTGNGGSSSGGSDTGDSGSSSGGSGSGSDSGAGSGTGNDGTSAGGSNGGSDSGASSGSGTGNGGSNSGSSSGTGDNGSSSGSSSGGTGSGTGGGDSSSGSGSGSLDNGSSNNGSVSETSSKLLVTVILMILPYLI